MEKTMTKAQKAKVGQKEKEQTREPNRYVRAARVLARDDAIDAKTLGDKAYMTTTTASRCLEAWRACVAALIDVGRLPDPARATQKKAAPKPKPVAVAKPAATETTATPAETIGTAAI
jgi:hypothetical protein